MSARQFTLTHKATGHSVVVTAQTDLAHLRLPAPEWMPNFSGAPIYSSRILLENAIERGEGLNLPNWKLEPLAEAQP